MRLNLTGWMSFTSNGIAFEMAGSKWTDGLAVIAAATKVSFLCEYMQRKLSTTWLRNFELRSWYIS